MAQSLNLCDYTVLHRCTYNCFTESMVSNLDDLDAIRDCCEEQEIAEANGTLSADVYKQLLTIYLIDNDVVSAKFLWKRIPEGTKTGNSELGSIWKVGQFLWKRDFENAYSNIESTEWSSVTKPLMERLRNTLRERMAKLISQAYSVVTVADVVKLLGMGSAEAINFAEQSSWQVDKDNLLVRPKKDVSTTDNVRCGDQSGTFDQLMNSLTDYVTFLEN